MPSARRPAHAAEHPAPAPSASIRAAASGSQLHLGNQALLRRLHPALAGIEVAHPEAPEERAAEAAADRPGLTSPPTGPAGGRVPSLNAALGSGRPLPEALARELAPNAGRGLEQVRVHTGERAADLAGAFAARAFTYGCDIVFGRDAYAPQTAAGRSLIAHELSHATQSATSGRIFRAPETAADVDQRVLKGMIDLVATNPVDDDARLQGLAALFATVPQAHIQHLHNRLEPGKKGDDFAQYFKDKYPTSRRNGLGALRDTYAGKFPGTSAAYTDIGKNTAEAAKTFMSLGVKFGQSMRGDGWYLNPKFWDLRYVLKEGSRREEFRYEPGGAKPYPSAAKFQATDPAWNVPNVTLDVEIRFGPFGPSAAIRDLFNAGSGSEYALDCLNAAWMVELRGRYMSYPEATRDVDFDREFDGYLVHHTHTDVKRSSSGQYTEVDFGKNVPLSDSAELTKLLQQGDEVTIANPFMPATHAFRNENAIYLGDLKFQGHPFKTAFTPADYSTKSELQSHAQGATAEEKADYVLRNAYIRNLSRPKTSP